MDSKTRDCEVRSGIAQGVGASFTILVGGVIFLRAGEIVLPAAAPATCYCFLSVLSVRFQHQSFSPLPEKCIHLIHPPPRRSLHQAFSRCGEWITRRAVEIEVIKRSRRKEAATRGWLGNALPSERAGQGHRRGVGTFWDAVVCKLDFNYNPGCACLSLFPIW